MLDPTTMKTSVRLNIESTVAHDTESNMGKGIAALCMGVRESGSLNKAAKNMNMSYSKAWRIIKSTEAALGFDLLIRDGAHGSTLTPEGDRILDAYLQLDRELREFAQKRLLEILA